MSALAPEVYVLVVGVYGAVQLNLLSFNHQGLVVQMLQDGGSANFYHTADAGVRFLPM